MKEVLQNIDWVTLLGIVWEVILLPIVCYLVKVIREYIHDKKISKYLEVLFSFAKPAVKTIYETYVKTIKGTDAWTTEAQNEALEMAKQQIIKSLSNSMYELLLAANEDFEAMLENAIEAAIYDLKREGKANE